MLTPKALSMLKGRGAPFTEEQLVTMTDRDAWKWYYQNFPRQPKPGDKPAVCFTGFTDAEREAIATRAASKFRVVSSVTQNLEFLVTGANPGPSKLAKAKGQGVTILTYAEYDQLWLTGDIAARTEQD